MNKGPGQGGGFRTSDNDAVWLIASARSNAELEIIRIRVEDDNIIPEEIGDI